MRERLLLYLVDPVSGEKFSLRVFAKEGGHVEAGLLETKRSWYPIINGIPRILIGELKQNMLREHIPFFQAYRAKLPGKIIHEWEREIAAIPDLNAFLAHQQKTSESFSFEWRHIYRENPFEEQNFLHFLSPFVSRKDFPNKLVVDVGCGSGRFTKQAARFGAKAAIGVDLSGSVDVAYELTKVLPNAHIIQSDIYALPIRRSTDLAFSIGVLHHLPEPEKGFGSMMRTVKKYGRGLIWVYNRRGNVRAIYLYEPLRALLRPLPRRLLLALCYFPAGIVQVMNWISVFVRRLGVEGYAKKIPFSYYTNFPFNMKLNDAFDVLSTPKSNYYYKEDIESWFRRRGLKAIRSYEHPEAGITSIGERR